MRRVPFFVLLTLLTTCSVRAEWAPNDAQMEGVEAFNAIRKEMGLPPFTVEERLCKAASAHAAFTARYRMSHDEKPGLPGFTGKTPAERARAAGFDRSYVREGIGYRLDYMSVTMQMRALLDAPYHRGPWHWGEIGHLGIGVNRNVLVVLYAPYFKEGSTVYPYNGQTGVAVSWARGENPDPRRVWKLTRQVGFPITYRWTSREKGPVAIVAASLTDPDGKPVSLAVNTPANDDKLSADMAILIPRFPLKPNTTYAAKVDARSPSGRDISHEWKFTTGDKVITDRRDSKTEELLNVTLLAQPETDGATARLISVDKARTRAFTVKARNHTGDRLASTRLKLGPSSMEVIRLKTSEPVYSVVIVPDGDGFQTPVTRTLRPG